MISVYNWNPELLHTDPQQLIFSFVAQMHVKK